MLHHTTSVCCITPMHHINPVQHTESHVEMPVKYFVKRLCEQSLPFLGRRGQRWSNRFRKEREKDREKQELAAAAAAAAAARKMAVAAGV